jgi:hypothetical protein
MLTKVRALGARIDMRDFVAGLLLLAAAGIFAFNGVGRLALGTPSSMGPGFFPMMIAGALAVTALIIIVRALGRASTMNGFVGPRAILCILGAPVLFSLAIEPLGFVPTIALTTLIAACSSGRMTWRFAVALSAGLTALCTGLFLILLRMPGRAFGDWLSW